MARPTGRPSPDRAPPASLPGGDPRGLLYVPRFIREPAYSELMAFLTALRPLQEWRFSTLRPPPPTEVQRPLLRPVYWLGNWQFACLGYYEPPEGRIDRAIEAEPFPPVMARLVADMERRIRKAVPPAHIPANWALNTCLVNFYGDRLVNGKWEDRARVGDHRDVEPGPVGSLSLGEKALFQFVTRGRNREVARTMWLEDASFQAFSGPTWKDSLLHRVQRVEDHRRPPIGPQLADTKTRRINLTFRYVPKADIVPYARMGATAKADVAEYVHTLAESSEFWRKALTTAPK